MTRITNLKGTRTGTLVEIRETPDGTSAKVRWDDRKIASWMWLRDIREDKGDRQ
jgi:hypothetical protein